MSGSLESRGRPVAMLAIIILGWLTARVAMWEAPPSVAAQTLEDQPAAPSSTFANPASGALATVAPESLAPTLASHRQRLPAIDAIHARPAQRVSSHAADRQTPEVGNRSQSVTGPPSDFDRSAAPAGRAGRVVEPGLPVTLPPSETRQADRWSADAWVLWRQGSGIAQGRRPSYGASQAGAVLNYRVRPTSPHDPRVFVRAYRALIDNPESEASLGISARPVPEVPLRVHTELRATERPGQNEIRPAAFVTTELPPLALPLQAHAEFYAQAGYVGGDFPTGFADGQLHVVRDLADLNFGRVSIGGGAWGGIQKGAERLDIGPSLRLDLNVGDVPARIALDWREQVAGDAEPGSGAALTVSSRF